MINKQIIFKLKKPALMNRLRYD